MIYVVERSLYCAHAALACEVHRVEVKFHRGAHDDAQRSWHIDTLSI